MHAKDHAMRKIVLLFMLVLAAKASAQDDVTPATVVDTTSNWEKINTVGFDLTEIAFVNWSAGGVSSVSGLAKAKFVRRYTDGLLKWNSELNVRYGMNKQDGTEWRKTDDVLELVSSAGFRRDSTSNWYSTAKFSFNTQFTNGYAYPNTDLAISKPFAPAYIFLGVGSEYADKENNFNVYISPLTMKSTLVLDQRLADQGSFGVRKAVYDPITLERLQRGQTAKTELGILFTGHHRHEIFKNITLEDKIMLYTDYLNKFGNIDIDWQMTLGFVVNEYVKATVSTHIIYDDDIKAKEERNGEQVTVGPKIQLKQLLGIGVVYNF